MPRPPTPTTSLIQDLDVYDVAILRATGRLGMITDPIAFHLLCSDLTEHVAGLQLDSLASIGLLHQQPMQYVANNQGLHVYHLTPAGAEALRLLGVDAPAVVDRMVVFDQQSQALTETGISRDGLYAMFCAAMLHEVRRAPGVYAGACCQRAYSVTGEGGAAEQTIGALLTIYLDLSQRAPGTEPWDMVWRDEGPVDTSWVALRLAVEIVFSPSDWEAQDEQAQSYARLAGQGRYRTLLGGDLALALRRSWAESWPQCPGLIGDRDGCWHPTYGPLWGSYQALARTPGQPATLLAPLNVTLKRWAALTSPTPDA